MTGIHGSSAISRCWDGWCGYGRRGGSSGRRPARAARPSNREPVSRDGACGTWGPGCTRRWNHRGRELCGPGPSRRPGPDSRVPYRWRSGRGPGAGACGSGCSDSSACRWSHVPLAIGSRLRCRERTKSKNCSAFLAKGPSRSDCGGDSSGSGGAGDQGCCPGEQPWATAVPSGPMTVMHQRVWGCIEAAPTRSLVSAGFRRPHPPAWDGVVSQPKRVPAWTRRLMTAGMGARAVPSVPDGAALSSS